jgi:septation ring formation regulator EzrA
MDQNLNNVLIIGGIVLMTLAVAVIIFNSIRTKSQQRNLNKNVGKLEQGVSKLRDKYSILQKIKYIKGSDFYQSSKKLDSIENKAKKIYNDELSTIDNHIFTVEDSILNKQFKGLEPQIKDMNEKVEIFDSELSNLQDEIDFMVQEVESKKSVYDRLSEKYRSLREEYLKSTDQILFMKNKLNSDFINCKSQIDNYRIVSENNVDAALVEMELDEISNKIKIRGNFQNEISTLNDIDHPKVEELISAALNAIPTFENSQLAKKYISQYQAVNDVYQDANAYDEKVLDELLDGTYKTIEEMKSFAQSETEYKEKYIKVNEEFQTEITRMEELHTKNMHEGNLINKKLIDEEFKNEIFEIEQKFQEIKSEHEKLSVGKVETYQANYVHYIKLLESIKELNTRQANISFEYSKLSDVEKSAREDFLMANQYLLDTKAMINKEHLPKIPDNFYYLEENVENSISKMNEIFNRESLDEFEVKKQNDLLIENVEKLNNYIIDLVKNKRRCEQLIVYVNRFDLNDLDKDVVTRAKRLFDDGAYIASIKSIKDLIQQKRK